MWSVPGHCIAWHVLYILSFLNFRMRIVNREFYKLHNDDLLKKSWKGEGMEFHTCLAIDGRAVNFSEVVTLRTGQNPPRWIAEIPLAHRWLCGPLIVFTLSSTCEINTWNRYARITRGRRQVAACSNTASCRWWREELSFQCWGRGRD